MSGGNALPAAIVVGSIVVGLGLYFGLRARAPVAAADALPVVGSAAPSNDLLASARVDVAAADDPRSPSAQAAAAVAAAAVGGGAIAAAPSDDPNVKAAAAALEGLRAKMVETCWKPAAKLRAEPKTATFSVMMNFDAQGKELMRGISETAFGDAARSEVAVCLRNNVVPISIPAPNVPVTAVVPLTLP